MEKLKIEEVKYYKETTEFLNEVTPLSTEKNKKKKGITGYTVESIIIILLAITVIILKFILKF